MNTCKLDYSSNFIAFPKRLKVYPGCCASITVLESIILAFLTVLLVLSTTAFADKKIVPVIPAVAKLEADVEEIPLSGSVFPWRKSALSPQVDGLVVEILIDDGDQVKKGALLIRLDSTIAKLNTQQAKAALGESQANYQESLRRRNEAAKLVQDRHVAATAYKALVAETRMKQAVQERLSAEYRRAVEIAKRYRILAPFDGIVGTVSIELGQWVESGEVVVKLFDIETLKIRAPVPQRYFSTINKDTSVTVRFDALSDQTFEAGVSRKIPIGNPATRTFPVRIDLTNPDHRIAPGMSARILFHIQGSNPTPVLTVPRDAVIVAPDRSESVWKISENQSGFTVKPVAVETGRFFRESVEITRGSISIGDRVVVRGNEILKPGQKVQLLNNLAD